MFDVDGGNKSGSALVTVFLPSLLHNAFSVAAFGEPRAGGRTKETEIGGVDSREVMEVVGCPLADVTAKKKQHSKKRKVFPF